MSLGSIGADIRYVLPASYDSVPQAFQSNKSAKPIPCVLQTVNVPSLTTSASASGTSIVQLPCGSSAGIMLNPYLRFDIALIGGDGTTDVSFKGATKSATSCINNLSTYINSMQIDNQQNADRIYDQVFAHGTSNDWVRQDASVLMRSNTESADVGAAYNLGTQCVPLLGLLGSQQGIPLYLFNGTLQINITWNALGRAIYAAGTAPTGFTISNVQLIYDRIAVETAFADRVKMDMMSGAKYVLGYTNFQNTALALASGSNNTLQYGLNASSLRAVVADQVLAPSTITDRSLSVSNTLTQFQVSLDGRLVNNNVLSASQYPIVFAELQKCYSRLFDASVSDYTSLSADGAANTFLTNGFAVGVSTTRCNEALAFAGSPVSVVSLAVNLSGGSAATMFVSFISDYQLLIDASGSVEIVR
jgi:hypothetical protein